MLANKKLTVTYLGVALAVGLGLGAGASLAQQAGSPSPLPPQYRGHGHPGERHPALHRAVRDLERARMALEKAPDGEKADGNAEKALKHVDQAIGLINKTLYPPK
ncbi:MAG: hypothetical protein FJZ01_02925 [Candidatus Sericytochromatia bacterium]|nr:hypothetical protein [Candidatus Tanganyikabacteria bacterium]